MSVRETTGPGSSCETPVDGDTSTVTVIDPIIIEGASPIVSLDPTVDAATITQAYSRTGTDCNDLQLGIIEFAPLTGGSGTYTYVLNGLTSSTPIFTGLTDDDYILSVRDANGCQVSLGSITVPDLAGENDYDFTVAQKVTSS